MFTDEDLKRLQDSIASYSDPIDGEGLEFNLKALLARLEAAEAYLKHHVHESDQTIEYKTWRKATGK